MYVQISTNDTVLIINGEYRFHSRKLTDNFVRAVESKQPLYLLRVWYNQRIDLDLLRFYVPNQALRRSWMIVTKAELLKVKLSNLTIDFLTLLEPTDEVGLYTAKKELNE